MSLARIGKRRFVGLDTRRHRDALLFTGAFLLNQPEIHIDATINGSLRAELCDSFGVTLPGYRREDFVSISGDSRQHVLCWKDKVTHDYQFDSLSLRFQMTDATIYNIEC